MARTFIGTLLLVVGVGAAQRLVACGDKYLSVGLGTHFHHSAAERRAARVLIYANSGSELSRLLTALLVEEAMNKAGYRPAIAKSTTDLDTALRAPNWDVILVDGREMPSVVPRLQKPAGPHLVPVLTRPTKDELKLAEKTYDTVLNTPSKNRVFVDVVDDAMDLHEIEVEAAAKAAKRSAR